MHVVQPPPQMQTPTSRLRNAVRKKIYAMISSLHKKVPASGSLEQREQNLKQLTILLDENLWSQAKSSEKAYADPGDLEARVVSLLKVIKYKCLLQKQQQQRRACPPPTSSSVDMMTVSSSSHPLHSSTNNNNNFAGGTFQSGNNIPCTTSGGFPVVPGFQRTEPLYSDGAHYQMVDVSRPQLTCSIPFGSSHLQGVVMPAVVAQDTRQFHPNPTFTNNQPYPLHHQLGNTTFQSASPQQLIFDRQAPASRQPSRQLQNQHHLLPHRTQRSSLPVNHGPSLDCCYNVALEQNGSKLQYQHNAARLTSSPSLPPHPHPHDQKQSPSVLVHRHSSLQNSTHLSEENYGDRERIGAIVSPMQTPESESLHRCSSARAPQNNNGERELTRANSCQTNPMQPERCSSERATLTVCHAERKGLVDGGNNTSSKQVNGDGSQDVRNQIRWLLFMEHARYCRATGDTCLSKFCLPVKKLLEHMKRCKVPDCTEPRCWQTRKLRLHYEECRNKSCPVCVTVNDNIKKNRNKRDAARPMESSEPVQAHNNDNNKRGAEAISVGDDNLQPSFKRLKIEQPSQIATCERESMSASVSGSSMPKKERYGLQSVKVEVMPMDIDVTLELEKHVSGFIPMGGESAVDEKTICLSSQVKPKCMNEMGAPKKENVKQCMDDVDESKMEISSMVELFTPEQVKEHIRGLRQWVGQSKTKAGKNKAMGGFISADACQLCAIEKLVFEPIPIYCSPCGVRIKRNAFHYSVAAGESRHHVCATCYNEARENSVSVDGTCIPKARLEKKKNDEQVIEGWVQCDKCQAWQHQICALFNSRRNHGEATKYTCPNCYIQEVEQGERRPFPESAIPGAKSLPHTTLSNHIEERLFKNLNKERQARARFQGKSYEEVPGAESLTVRVVASVDKVLEVKENFLELFRGENYPSEFSYKSKVILLFQKIEGVEVCLFGMFVQEFGTESGPANQRRVYLSYLDSVKYFRPEVRTVSGEALRTFVYHEILIGYLDYCKKRGFTSCYIWACPPLKGEDYILNCHPEIQKTPKTDKLREWYLEMLRKASEEDVVVECTNLYDQFFVQPGECRANVTAARLPYFDGDYWPGAAEDLIQQMRQEGDGTTTKLNKKGYTKKVISKRALRAIGQLDLSVNASKDRLMMQKLGEIICPMKEDFIMVHLQHCCKHCCTLMVSGNRWVCNRCKNFQICDKCYRVEQKRAEKERHPINRKVKHSLFPVAIKDVPIEIKDKDEIIQSECFDNRQAFLNLCQGNNYQYDTLRRAKHSSMMILYHLHNPSAPAFPTACTICQQEIQNAQGWHCQVCTAYDVCDACYPKASINHSHKLISRSSAAETTSVQRNGKANQILFDKMIELLVHVATPCHSAQCQYQRCRWMKTVIRHIMNCKMACEDCTKCRQFWTLIRMHSLSCRDSQCTVPKCRDFKAATRRRQQQSEKRRRAAVTEMMRKRAAEATQTC
ncbi:histone acetyltransferase of the CBP family 4 [Raphanus sativus]|nr:histone acetyltransferase of the CBP family 4 [Raphanus sativus]